jgi:hypothetical protein
MEMIPTYLLSEVVAGSLLVEVADVFSEDVVSEGDFSVVLLSDVLTVSFLLPLLLRASLT